MVVRLVVSVVVSDVVGVVVTVDVNVEVGLVVGVVRVQASNVPVRNAASMRELNVEAALEHFPCGVARRDPMHWICKSGEPGSNPSIRTFNVL